MDANLLPEQVLEIAERARLGINNEIQVSLFIDELCKLDGDWIEWSEAACVEALNVERWPDDGRQGISDDEEAPDEVARFRPADLIRAQLVTYGLEDAAEGLDEFFKNLYASGPRSVTVPVQWSSELSLCIACLIAASHCWQGLKQGAASDRVKLLEMRKASRQEVKKFSLALMESFDEEFLGTTSLALLLRYLEQCGPAGKIYVLNSFVEKEIPDSNEIAKCNLKLPKTLTWDSAFVLLDGRTFSYVGLEYVVAKALQPCRISCGSVGQEVEALGLAILVDFLNQKYWNHIDPFEPEFRIEELTSQVINAISRYCEKHLGRLPLRLDQCAALLQCHVPDYDNYRFSRCASEPSLALIMAASDVYHFDLDLEKWGPDRTADERLEIWSAMWRSLFHDGYKKQAEAVFCITCFLEMESAQPELMPLVERYLAMSKGYVGPFLSRTAEAILRRYSDRKGTLMLRLRELVGSNFIADDPARVLARKGLERHFGKRAWLSFPVKWKDHFIERELVWQGAQVGAACGDYSHLVTGYFKFIELEILPRVQSALAKHKDELSEMNSTVFAKRVISLDKMTVDDALKVLRACQRHRLPTSIDAEIEKSFPGIRHAKVINRLFDLKEIRNDATHKHFDLVRASDARQKFLDPESVEAIVSLW